MEDAKFYFDKIKKEPYYKNIESLVKIFEESGMIFRSTGHCMAMSDLVQRLLSEQGIESYLLECTLTVITRDPFTKVDFLGHDTDSYKNKQQVETHVVCITKTKIPILIDLSIGYITKKVNYVVFPIFEELISNPENILTIDFGHSLWIYNKRALSNLPELHEKSIINRIDTDIKTDEKFKKVFGILCFLIVITTLNFIRGTYDHYQKYINKTNGFGPNKTIVDIPPKNVYK